MPRAYGYWPDGAGRESSKRNRSVIVDERKRATTDGGAAPIIRMSLPTPAPLEN
jgi:hypothetical protein